MEPTPARLEAAGMFAIAALAAAIELHDVGAPGHNAEVADLAVAIGVRMGLDDASLLILARASLLHDLGKLGIPSLLLHKSGAPTEAEWDTLKKHPMLGLDILSRIGDMDHEKAIILAHHERLDGSGYPNALSGGQIPLAARILAVADSYQAMISDRPYRHGLGTKASLAALDAGRGSAFDPDCVDALTNIIEATQEYQPPSSANRRTGVHNRRFLGTLERRLQQLAQG
jgi:HD-GYP domain-containing protein (c-di-GMP phosphodiesterase class II)